MLNDMITVTPAFLGKLVITLKRYDSFIVISLACSSFQDSSRESRSKKLRTNRMGWGGLGGTGKWSFWYTLDSSILIVYVNTYVKLLASCAPRQTNMASSETFLHILPREAVSGSWLPAPVSVFLASTLLLLFLPLPALLELSPSAISSSASRTSAAAYSPGLPKPPSFPTKNVLF